MELRQKAPSEVPKQPSSPKLTLQLTHSEGVYVHGLKSLLPSSTKTGSSSCPAIPSVGKGLVKVQDPTSLKFKLSHAMDLFPASKMVLEGFSARFYVHHLSYHPFPTLQVRGCLLKAHRPFMYKARCAHTCHRLQ